METFARTMTTRLARASLLLSATSALLGCQLRPDILSAHSYRSGNDEIVEVSLQSVDAKKIKNRELYFSVVVVNCTGKLDPFPAESYIDGQRAAEFRFATTGEGVAIVGRVPAKIFNSYQHPCVFLEGGGYLTGTLKSALVPITKRRGYGA
jgi:hypothetical protein